MLVTLVLLQFLFFFFSSRRRHTRSDRDWSSDVCSSDLMGFRDDIVVRVRADGEGARVDVRSSSRYGSFDFGANAARVRSLVEDIDDAVGDRKSGVEGKSVDLGGRRIIKKKKKKSEYNEL